jgi:hypothetical protein
MKAIVVDMARLSEKSAAGPARPHGSVKHLPRPARKFPIGFHDEKAWRFGNFHIPSRFPGKLQVRLFDILVKPSAF